MDDAKLLAILLRVGTRGIGAIDLARYLLSGFGSLGRLINADIKPLLSYKGIGTANFTQFTVIREIGRRTLSGELRENIIFSNPRTVADYLHLNLGHERMGASYALFLNRQNQLITVCEFSRGAITENTVYIYEIVKFALDEYVDSLVIAHNHPGGSTRPFEADTRFMKRLVQTLDLVDVSPLDHSIVAAKEVYPLRGTDYMD